MTKRKNKDATASGKVQFNHKYNQQEALGGMTMINQQMLNIWKSNAKIFRLAALMLSIFAPLQTHADIITPPKYEVVDELGINLVTGQVSLSLETVSIGGEMGISHSISSQTNNFVFQDDGYIDKFDGGVKWVPLGKNLSLGANNCVNNMYCVMRAFAPVGNQDFKVVSYNPIVYEAIGDTRHTLEVDAANNQLIWTTHDGTVVRFDRRISPPADAISLASLKQIVYPNGFTITKISDGVQTNTGFYLKYLYVDDFSLLDPSKLGRTFGPETNVPPQSPNGSYEWSGRNPKYIYAYNAAVEYCPPGWKTPCNFDKDWPIATFNWPGGMPRAIYIDDTVFSVETPNGTTEFHFKAFDLALRDPYNPSSAISNPYVRKNEKISARLVGFKPANASEITTSYTYDNVFQVEGPCGALLYCYPWLVSEAGRIRAATGLKGTSQYSDYEMTTLIPGYPRFGPNSPIQVHGRKLAVTTHQTIYPGELYEISHHAVGVFTFENSFRNFVEIWQDTNGPKKKYYYDARDNLERVTFEEGTSEATEQEAHYPATCSNRKTCNKPEWTEDAKGNRTSYTYHSASGQVESITYPANEQGKIAATRYSYGAFYAQVLNSSGQLTQADGPIYLKTAEKYCANSNYSDGGCANNDEVVIGYEYNHNNLLMTGMTVNAEGTTRRTCYAYDIYGNRIGVTQPKADLSSCP